MKKPTKFQEWVEKNYSRKAFPALSKVGSTVSDAVPVNIGDVTMIAPFILSHPALKDHPVAKGIGVALNVQSLVGMSVMLNNFRVPLECKLGLELEELEPNAVKADLRNVANDLISQYNQVLGLQKPSENELLDLSDKCLDDVMMKIEGYTVRGPKKIKRGPRIQVMHKYFGVEGQFSPTTHEVNIPKKNEALSPFVVTHEKAHSKGYTREYEANMVAYLSCMQTGSPHFEASANNWRLAFGLTTIDADLKEKSKFVSSLGLPKELESKYQGMLAKKEQGQSLFSKFQDKMLKVMGEKEGVKSYNETFTKIAMAYDKNGKKI